MHAVSAANRSAALPWLRAVFANQEAFLKKWSEIAPSTLDPPAFASEFMAKTAEPPKDGAPVPSKLTFNFYLPHEKPYR